jgi:Uma2 family endonuclease
VIEVSDNSLARDLGLKRQMYARAGIGQYVVVDLVHDVVLDHRTPFGDGYQDVTTLRAGGTMELGAGERSVPVLVDRLLP